MKRIKIYLFLLLSSTILCAQETKEKKHIKLPVISFGQGLLNFNGDIGYKKYSEPITSRSGYQIEVQNQTSKRISFSLFFLSGRVSGDEKSTVRNVNFKSSILDGGLSVRYDFLSRKRDNQILIPFITAGIEYIFFDSFTDIKDANGQPYYYWDDGSIKNIAQDDPASDQATILYRDYYYESDLREANLDGFGKYKNTTWGVPVGIGARLKISNRFSMHFSSVYHITGTDYIDGITKDSKGDRKGNPQNDNFLFSSVSLRFALSDPDNDDNGIDFNSLVNEDADQDGIVDILDDSSGTPVNNAVDINGKPIDTDKDGIPDYRDKEANSAIDAVVSEEGVTITEEMIEEKFRKDSLAALPAVIEYLKSYDKLTERNPEVEKRWIEKNVATNRNAGTDPIPPVYGHLDTDFNGILTPKEMSVAIDDYLAKRSNFTVAEFFDLIDFFFSQK